MYIETYILHQLPFHSTITKTAKHKTETKPNEDPLFCVITHAHLSNLLLFCNITTYHLNHLPSIL